MNENKDNDILYFYENNPRDERKIYWVKCSHITPQSPQSLNKYNYEQLNIVLDFIESNKIELTDKIKCTIDNRILYKNSHAYLCDVGYKSRQGTLNHQKKQTNYKNKIKRKTIKQSIERDLKL